jgi:archaellum component FlaC
MAKRNLNALVTVKMLNEAVDAILRGVERMFDKQDKRIDGLDKRIGGMDKRIGGMDTRLARVETDVRDIRRRMIDHEVDTPTRKEFSDLKARVDKHHPLVG